MKKRFTLFLPLAVLFLTLASCGGDDANISENLTQKAKEKTDAQKKEITYSKEQIKELKAASKVVYTLPSPSEMAKILHQSKAVYDVEILNNVRNINNYISDRQQSLNLGVYFADLSFTSMYDFPQQAMMFMGAAQALSEELNIDGVFTEDLMHRLENNLGNKDSLMQIVADAYLETENVLQDEHRPIIAKSILAGGWIEGLYIACHLKIESAEHKKEIRQNIASQKPALENLVQILKKIDTDELNDLIVSLVSLEEVYKEVEIKSMKNKADSIQYAKANEAIISDEVFEKIKNKVTAIRNKIINGNI